MEKIFDLRSPQAFERSKKVLINKPVPKALDQLPPQTLITLARSTEVWRGEIIRREAFGPKSAFEALHLGVVHPTDRPFLEAVNKRIMRQVEIKADKVFCYRRKLELGNFGKPSREGEYWRTKDEERKNNFRHARQEAHLSRIDRFRQTPEYVTQAPLSTTMLFGLEVELERNRSFNSWDWFPETVSKTWKTVHDGSLRSAYAREFVSRPQQGHENACLALRRLHAVLDLDPGWRGGERCGMHIHFSLPWLHEAFAPDRWEGRKEAWEEVRRDQWLIERVRSLKTKIEELTPARSRHPFALLFNHRKENKYCRFDSWLIHNACNELVRTGDRYSWLNTDALIKHGTLELRLAGIKKFDLRFVDAACTLIEFLANHFQAPDWLVEASNPKPLTTPVGDMPMAWRLKELLGDRNI